MDQLDVTCFIISLFTAQHVSNVSTSIFRSLRLFVDLFHVLYCSGYGVVRLGCYAGWGTSASACIRIMRWGSASRLGRSYPRERPGTYCTGGWVCPRAGMDRCGKSRPPPGFDPRTVQPVASRYTDWATRPTIILFSNRNITAALWRSRVPS